MKVYKSAFFLIALLISDKVHSQDPKRLDFGTLPPGKSIIVKYDVVIDNPLPEGVNKISNQLTISGSNITSTLTDDHSTQEVFDATIKEVIVNSIPTISGVIASQLVSDKGTIAPFKSIAISDEDFPAQTLLVTVVLDAADKGHFTILNGFTHEGDGIYKFTGTTEAVNLAISGLVFAPAANRVIPGLTETTTFTLTISDGQETISESGTTVIATSTNDSPILSGGTLHQSLNDSGTIAPFANVVIADLDNQEISVTVIVNNGLNRGDFTAVSSYGWKSSVVGDDIKYFRNFHEEGNNSSLAQSSVNSLIFQPRKNSIASGFSETTYFSIDVDDGYLPVSSTLEISTVSTSLNDAPVIVSEGGGATASISLAENGTTVTTVLANDVDAESSISYSLNGGADYTKFQIDTGSGVLSFLTAPDFDAPTDANTDNRYEVVVKATDGMDLDQQAINVVINDINDEVPVITAGQSFRINENAINGTSLGLLKAIDKDATKTDFQDWVIKDGNINNAFVINSGTGEISVNNEQELNSELISTYRLILAVSDGVNASLNETVNVVVNDINDEAPIIGENQNFSINENSVNGTSLGLVTATDGDLSNTVFQHWTITSGNINNVFAINSTTGELAVNNAVLDHELLRNYTLTLTVGDGVNTSLAETITVQINDVNDNSPVILPDQNFEIDENSSNGALLGRVQAIDVDDTSGTLQEWVIRSGNTNNVFALNASTGHLFVNNSLALDRELFGSYTLTLAVGDGVHISTVESIKIIIKDENDSPPVIAINQSFNVDENSGGGTSLGAVQASDSDIITATLQNWTITGGNADNAFSINHSTGELVINNGAQLNREHIGTYVLALTVSDGVHTSATRNVVISINDVNDIAPSIALNQNFNVKENSIIGTLIGTVVANDEDATATILQKWAITGGNTNDIFEINSTTGELTVHNSSGLDFELTKRFTLTISVTDGINASMAERVSITVNNINDVVPIILDNQKFRINENSAIGTSLGRIRADDGDATQTIFQDWTIVGGNINNGFVINSSTGEITVNNNSALDFEVTGSHTLTLTVKDGLNTSLTKSIDIAINDVNDISPVVTSFQSFNINENSARGTSLGFVQATDGDATPTSFRNWTITDGNTYNSFEINASTGELTVNNSLGIDRELTKAFTLTLTVGDGVNVSSEESINIRINDANDVIPVIAVNQFFNIKENADNGILLGRVQATDGDITPTAFQNWVIIEGNINGAFEINGLTGELSINCVDLDRELREDYALIICVSDGVNISNTETVRIKIDDVNDIIPFIAANQSFSVDENSTGGTSLGIVQAADNDATSTTFQHWTISAGNINNAFAINSLTGELTVNNRAQLDSEQKESYTLIIIVGDGVNTSIPETVEVTINDVNDLAPVITANQNFSVNENSMPETAIGTVAVLDGDLTTATFKNWTIVGGNTKEAFKINLETGLLSVHVPILDFENKNDYELILQVSDGKHVSQPQSIRIRLNDQSETLANTIFLQSVLYENQPAGTFVGELKTTSDDPTAIFTYSLVSGEGDADNNLFYISGDRIKTSTSLNFEEKVNYNVRVRSIIESGLCQDQEFVIKVDDVNDPPTLESINDQVLCYTTAQQVIALKGLSAGEDAGQETSITISSTNREFFSELLMEGNEVKYRIKEGITGTALVFVKIKDSGGTVYGGVDTCERSFNVIVGLLPLVSIISDKGTHLSKGLVTNLRANGGVSYQWESAPGIISGLNMSTLAVRPVQTTTYRVKVTNERGCSTIQGITIQVCDDYRVIEANNVLSPNGDGINDKLKFNNMDMYPQNEVKIYDHAGRLLYYKKNYTNEWNGTFEGTPLEEDTYFYIVDFGPNVTPIKGFITILKD